MQVVSFSESQFPHTAMALVDRIKNINIANTGSFAIFGGCARSALLEATSGIAQPIRDLDIEPIGAGMSEDEYRDLHKKLNPNDPDNVIKMFGSASLRDLFENNVDFTINQAALSLEDEVFLYASKEAIKAACDYHIEPTAGRIAVTKALKKENLKQFQRNQTDMPARAASFVARFRVAVLDFSFDLLDHPVPRIPFRPNSVDFTRDPEPIATDEAHPFYLGLMIRKTLSIDDMERGPLDITATRVLLELYKETGLLDDETSVNTVQDVIKICEAANYVKPAIRFDDGSSAVGNLVNHTERAPEPKTN